jgi:hypothetical protein
MRSPPRQASSRKSAQLLTTAGKNDLAWGCCRKAAGSVQEGRVTARATYFLGTNIQATTVKKAVQLAT